MITTTVTQAKETWK